MNQPQRPSQRHTWRPADRHDRPTRLQVHRRTLDGVRGEPFLVHPVPLVKAAEKPAPAIKKNHTRVHSSLGAAARRHSLLEQATMQAAKADKQKKSIKHKLRPTKLRLLTVFAVIVLTATGYVTVDTWLTNRKVLAQAQQQNVASEQDKVEDKNPNEQAQQSTASETKRYSLADYKVAPDMPRAIFIKKINMSGRILPMGLKDGAVDAPKNAYDAGWYTGSAKPGTKGAAFFDGHTSDVGNYGLFGKFNKLTDGDVITVEIGDGTRIDYKVIGKEQVPKDSVDMSKAMKVQGGSDEGATFVTCAGKWIESEKTMTERLIVYTERV